MDSTWNMMYLKGVANICHNGTSNANLMHNSKQFNIKYMDSFKPKEAAAPVSNLFLFFFSPSYSLTIAIPALWSFLLSCLLFSVSPLCTKKGCKWVAGQMMLTCLGEPSFFPLCFWAGRAPCDIWLSWQPQPAKLLFWFHWIKVKNLCLRGRKLWLESYITEREGRKGARVKIKVWWAEFLKSVMQKKWQVLDLLVDKASSLCKQAESAR